jgi:hypothetical protein
MKNRKTFDNSNRPGKAFGCIAFTEAETGSDPKKSPPLPGKREQLRHTP